jgi:hypothetical protein
VSSVTLFKMRLKRQCGQLNPMALRRMGEWRYSSKWS